VTGSRPRAIAAGAFALLFLAAVPMSARGADPPAKARIVSELRIDSGGPVAESLELTVPLSGELREKLAELRRTPPDPLLVYDRHLEEVFRELMPVRGKGELAAILAAQEEPARLQIADGVGTLKLDLFYPMLWQLEGPEHLRFEPVPLGADTRLAAVLHAPGPGVDAATPLPWADDGGGNLKWVFGGDSTPRLKVTLAQPLTGRGGEAARGAASFLVFLLPLLIFVALLLWAPRPLDRGAWTALRICAGIGVAAIGAAGYFGIVEWQVITVNQLFTITQENWLSRSLKLAIPALGIAAFAATPPRPRAEAAARGGLGLLLGLLLTACVERLHAILFDPVVSDIRWPYALLGSIAAVLLLALVIDTTLLWLDHIWSRTRQGEKARLTLFGLRGRAVIASVVVATAVLQVLFATTGGDGVNDPHPTLEDILAGTPLAVCNLLLIASLPLFSLAVFSLLWERAAEKRLSFRSAWEGLMLGLVIATAVIGLIGSIDGYPAPGPFLISLLSLGGGLYLLANGSRASLTRLELTPNRTDLLLDRWLSLRQLSPGSAGASGQEIEEGERQRQQRRELLDQPELVQIEEEHREREMLDLGLSSARSAAERLRLLADNGWLILVVPIVYSALMLIDQEGRSGISSEQPHGLLFLLSAVFAQSTMWLLAVAGFVLVYPLLPGRLGVVKGLLAGIFVGVPWLIVQPLHGNQVGLHLTYFIPAVLTLLFGATGLFLDFSTIRRRHEDLKQLSEIYGLTKLRASLVAIPVLILIFTIIQGLASGQGAEALSNAASDLPGALP
jgi:hypothetical protein